MSITKIRKMKTRKKVDSFARLIFPIGRKRYERLSARALSEGFGQFLLEHICREIPLLTLRGCLFELEEQKNDLGKIRIILGLSDRIQHGRAVTGVLH